MNKFRPVKLGREKDWMLSFSRHAQTLAPRWRLTWRCCFVYWHQLCNRFTGPLKKWKLENCNRKYQKDSIRRITWHTRSSAQNNVSDCARANWLKQRCRILADLNGKCVNNGSKFRLMQPPRLARVFRVFFAKGKKIKLYIIKEASVDRCSLRHF